MNTFFFFLGGFAAAALAVWAVVAFVRSKIRRFSRQTFGMENLADALGELDNAADQQPKSLSGGDSLFLPRILKDFPDFNVDTAKARVRDGLLQTLEGKQNPIIHRIVISDYRRTALERTIVFQAALQYDEGGAARQKRYCVHDSYLLPAVETSGQALVCPNCGAPIADTAASHCTYCDARLVNITGNSWKITQSFEK
ncbi:MAG: zinc ribbon domain-containing protein [Eubacteriales bacterium]|nr:zinc ribbon domain-containing protein [Eubacteriales bacterium]